MTITLTELECERLGRLHGELVATEVAALRRRVEMLEAELARRDAAERDQAGQAFNAEMERLGEKYKFDARNTTWRLETSTHSLVQADGQGEGS